MAPALTPGPSDPSARRELGALLAACLALVTANSYALSLPALDDCFYARKGLEMSRSGLSFTLTWDGSPNFQNPPLQFWILALCYRLFGENGVSLAPEADG